MESILDPEFKRLLIEGCWGLLKHILICGTAGFGVLCSLTSIAKTFPAMDRAMRGLTKKGKLKCWFHLSVLLGLLAILFRSLS